MYAILEGVLPVFSDGLIAPDVLFRQEPDEDEEDEDDRNDGDDDDGEGSDDGYSE